MLKMHTVALPAEPRLLLLLVTWLPEGEGLGIPYAPPQVPPVWVPLDEKHCAELFLLTLIWKLISCFEDLWRPLA